MKDFIPQICRTCDPSHVENCPDCFGWGLRDYSSEDGPIPIAARHVGSGKVVENWVKCKTCNGTPKGLDFENK